MQIVCEREAFARGLGQVEIRFGDPHTPLLFRPDRAGGGMHRMEACRLRPCRCRLEEASRSEIELAGPAQNAFTPRNARNELRPREKPLEGASSKRLYQFGF
jgi:hypothetical protein